MRASGPSKPASGLPRYARVLLAAIAAVGMALGAAACGPSSPHPKKTLGPGGY